MSGAVVESLGASEASEEVGLEFLLYASFWGTIE